MQKTKNLVAIGAACLTLLSSIAFVSCGEKHTHQYLETVIPSTCSTKGYTEYKCACGDSYKDYEQELLEHNGRYQCSVCETDYGKKFKEIILANATNEGFIDLPSNHTYYTSISTQKTYTNDNYEVIMVGEFSIFEGAPEKVYLGYSSFDQNWTWVLEMDAVIEEKTYSATGTFKTLTSTSTYIPCSYSTIPNGVPTSLLKDFFATMVYNANQKLKLYNAGFTMENLGLKF